MGETCSNCDCRVAKKICLDLPSGENLFCLDCAEYHLRIKKFKTHRFEDYISKDGHGAGKEHTCGNCEENLAKFVCDSCEDECKYLCLGCSMLHTKVKIYRNHKMEPLYALPSTTPGDASKLKTPKGESGTIDDKDGFVEKAYSERKVRFMRTTKSGGERDTRSTRYAATDNNVVEYEEETLSSYLDQLVEMSEFLSDYLDLWMRADDLYSRSVLIAVCLVAFLLLKVFAGKLSTIILIAIALILILMRSRGNGKQIIVENGQQNHGESIGLTGPGTNVAKNVGESTATTTHPLSYHQGPPGIITGITDRTGAIPISLATSGIGTSSRGSSSISGASGGVLGMNMESPSFSTESGHLSNVRADPVLMEEFKEEFWHTTITESRAKKKNMKVQIKERKISC